MNWLEIRQWADGTWRSCQNWVITKRVNRIGGIDMSGAFFFFYMRIRSSSVPVTKTVSCQYGIWYYRSVGDDGGVAADIIRVIFNIGESAYVRVMNGRVKINFLKREMYLKLIYYSIEMTILFRKKVKSIIHPILNLNRMNGSNEKQFYKALWTIFFS